MTKQCTLSFGRAQMSLERPVLPSTPTPASFRAPPPRPTMAGSPHTFGSGSGMSEWSGCECSSLSAAGSDIGESASTVAFSREFDILNRLVTIEVQDWLDKIVQDVIDVLCCDSKYLKVRRTRYRPEERVAAVSALEKLKKENPNATKVYLQKKLNQRMGNGKVTVQCVERWGIQKAAKERKSTSRSSSQSSTT